jgi:hypothetical protein
MWEIFLKKFLNSNHFKHRNPGANPTIKSYVQSYQHNTFGELRFSESTYIQIFYFNL